MKQAAARKTQPSSAPPSQEARSTPGAALPQAEQPEQDAPAGQDGVEEEVYSRVTAYTLAAARFRERAARSRREEEEWTSGLGVLGHVVELFDGERRPDSGRWTEIEGRWAQLEAQLEAVGASRGRTDVRAAAGTASGLVSAFRDLAAEESEAREAFLAYLGAFSETADDGAWLATTTRDAAFLGAVSIATGLALPAIGAASTAAAGAVGLTGTAATVGSAAGSVAAVGAMGGAIEGGLRGGTALLSEMIDLVAAAEQAGQRSLGEAEGIDWARIGEEGWLGIERGFVNGVMSRLGIAVEAMLRAPAAAGLARALGPVGQTLRERLLRTALEAAVAGGATSSVVGALREGLHATIAGEPTDVVVARMQRAFLTGLASGAALGGGTALAKGLPSGAISTIAPTPKLIGAAKVGTAVGAGAAATAQTEVGSWFGRAAHAVGEKVDGWVDGAADLYRGAVSKTTDLIALAAETHAGLGGGTLSVETDLDAVVPLLPPELQASLALSDAPGAGNRARLALDTEADTLTLSVPDLHLAGLGLGGFRADDVVLSGLVLTVAGARAAAREAAGAMLGPDMLRTLFGAAGTGRVTLRVDGLRIAGLQGDDGTSLREVDVSEVDIGIGAAKGGEGTAADLSIGALAIRGVTLPERAPAAASGPAVAPEAAPEASAPSGSSPALPGFLGSGAGLATARLGRLSISDLSGPDGSLSSLEGADLRASLTAANGFEQLAAGPRGVGAEASVGSLAARGVRAGQDGADQVGLDGLSLSVDPSRARANLALASLSAQGVVASGTRLGSGKLTNLGADLDADGAAPELPSWALGLDEPAATGHLSLGGAEIRDLRSGGMSLGSGSLGGLAVDKQGRSVKGSLDRTSVAQLRAGDTRLERASIEDVSTSVGLPGQSLAAMTGSVSVGRAAASGIGLPQGRVGSASVDGLVANKGAGGSGSASIRRAHVAGAKFGDATVGEATAKGLRASVDRDRTALGIERGLVEGAGFGENKLGSLALMGLSGEQTAKGQSLGLDMAWATDVRSPQGRLDRSTVIDLSASMAASGRTGRASVGSVSAEGIAAAGASLDHARVKGASGSLTEAGATVGADEVAALGGRFEQDGTRVSVGNVSLSGLAASQGKDGVDASLRRGEIGSVDANVLIPDAPAPSKPASPQSAPPAPSSPATAAKAPAKAPAQPSLPELVSLVRQAELSASVPLNAADYAGGLATIEKGTTASVSAAVQDGRVVPERTGVHLNQGVDAPLWFTADGVSLERRGDRGRIRAELGGLPDLDVTRFVPGVEGGVPLELATLATLATKTKPDSAPKTSAPQPASPPSATAQTGSAPAASPVDLDALRASGSVTLGGSVHSPGTSAVIGQERPADNRIDFEAAGVENVAARFVGLLVGALTVDLGGIQGSAGKLRADAGAVQLSRSGSGRAVQGRLGKVTLEDVAGQSR